jgi:isomerase DpgB
MSVTSNGCTATTDQTLRNATMTVTTILDCAIMPSNDTVSLINKALDESEDAGPEGALVFDLRGGGSALPGHAFPRDIDNQLVSRWERMLRRIERAPATTVVLTDGINPRFALDFLAVVDRRVGTKHMVIERLRSTREVWPGMALYRLSRQMGEAGARKLYLENRDIGATAALNLNLLDEVVEDVPEGLARIDRFLADAPCNFSLCRRLMQESATATYEEALGSHLAACDRFLRRVGDHVYRQV